jgi:hypothetical protein
VSFFSGRQDLQVKPGISDRIETHFSWLRTRMSVERTLMSWVRTATALIGFGFTIFQFFERFNQMSDVAAPRNPGNARIIALALVGNWRRRPHGGAPRIPGHAPIPLDR